MDLRGKSTIRGLRNNNPGNIIKSNSPWKGKVPHSLNTDSRFEQFEQVEYGLRALMRNARTLVQRGHNTISKLVTKWAPPVENDTQKYINFVCKSMGVSPTQKITLDKDFYIQFAKFVTFKECGKDALKIIPESAFEEAYRILDDGSLFKKMGMLFLFGGIFFGIYFFNR